MLASEHTSANQRAKAIAFVSAAYGIGAGLVAVLRGLGGEGVGFRVVIALAALPLVMTALAGRLITETDRFAKSSQQPCSPTLLPVLGGVFQARRRRHLGTLAAITFASGLVTGPAASFLFVYAENVLDVSTAFTGVLVVAAGLTGLAGLMVGRWLADWLGRRPAGAIALGLVAAAGVLTYSGSVPALAVGYVAGVLFGAAYGPAAIALTTELFPTGVRATAAGWMVVAGVLGATTGLLLAGSLADSLDSFTGSMAAVCLPAGLATILFAALPETRGNDLEQTAPEVLASAK